MLRPLTWILLCFAVPLRAETARLDADNPVRTAFRGERLDLWSLQPLREVPVPQTAAADGVLHPVDAFVLHRLEREGLRPAPRADRRTLARRLASVLTGLPPDDRTLEAFCADESPDAFERLTDSLLASPDFGIHWAGMWLDTVRYSDSNGYDWDEFRPQGWRYRDYVVRSFQEDKPFDRFLREQLAGDELAADAPDERSRLDALVATGYLRLGPQDNSAKLFGEENRERAAFEADMAETTATAFLGMTLRCCRCHNHKTDPLTRDDHYRFRAFFAGVVREDDVVIDPAAEREAIQSAREECDRQVAAREADRSRIFDVVRDRLVARSGGDSEEEIPEKRIRSELTESERADVSRLDSEIERLRGERPAFTTAPGVSEDRDKPLAVPVLNNGEAGQPSGHAVEPGIFAYFDAGPADLTANGTRPPSRRRALADWIVSPDNPLTARVLVNRIWQQCFGEGIVATADDFGYAGAPPSHPELLDWLALRFRQDGWSLKRTVRLLVTSSAWQQSAWVTDAAARERGTAKDPDNTLLWHANPRCLTAEQLRDSLLRVAGRLTEDPSGPPVWPELPPEVLQANPAFLDDNAEKTKSWYPSEPHRLHVRSIRLIRKRSVRIPFLETFGLPDSFESCTRRLESTGAPQALTLLNHPMVADVCTATAGRVAAAAGDDPAAQIDRAFALILQRPPAPDEAAACLSLLRDRSLAEVCRVLVNTSEFLVID